MLVPGRQLDLAMTPLEALARWPRDRQVMMLHSGRFHARWSRQSILAEPVGCYRFTHLADGDGCGQWVGPIANCPANLSCSDKPFRDLRSLVAATGDGIWLGYLSYDLGRWVEKLPTAAVDDLQWPIIELAYCPGYLLYDGQQQSWSACGSWREQLPIEFSQPLTQPTEFRAGSPRSLFSRAEYEAAVAKAMEYIAAGDIFQVNLAQRFTADFQGEQPSACRAMFERLATLSPAWYGAYLELMGESAGQQAVAKNGRVIASTSPELFLEVDATGHVVTRPIKGTRPASVHPSELLHSEKDTAELNMIVDLLRNDLGRVCSYGSVQVDEPRTIESHPTVHHGVATIRGKLHPGKDMIDLLRAAMPGGSITGAPKVRAMQIIDELEPVRRGPYCGSIGWLTANQMCLNIAIRTMLLDGAAQRVDFSVGGGIVADSNPASEYDETIAKAQAMLQALMQGK